MKEGSVIFISFFVFLVFITLAVYNASEKKEKAFLENPREACLRYERWSCNAFELIPAQCLEFLEEEIQLCEKIKSF